MSISSDFLLLPVYQSVVVQKYIDKADKDRQVYVRTLAAYEASRLSDVSCLFVCF